MIDITNIFQLVSFIVLAVFALIYLLGTVIVLARKGRGASKTGVVFYILAWILLLPALALTLVGVICRFKPFGLAVTTVNGEFSLLLNAKELFSVPFVGKFIALINKYFVMEILAYALFALLLLSVIVWLAKWKAVSRAKREGVGYLTVEPIEEVASVEEKTEPVEVEFAESELNEWLADEENEQELIQEIEEVELIEEPLIEEPLIDEEVYEEPTIEQEEVEETAPYSQPVESESVVEELIEEPTVEEEIVEENPVEEETTIEEETPSVEEVLSEIDSAPIEQEVVEQTEPIEETSVIDSLQDIANTETVTESEEEKPLDFSSIVFRPRSVYKPERKRANKAHATVKSSLPIIQEEKVEEKVEPITETVVEETPAPMQEVKEEVAPTVERVQPIPVIAVKNGDSIQYVPIQYVMPQQLVEQEQKVAVEPEKKKRRVTTKAGQLFSQYMKEVDDEEKKKLQGSIDTVNLKKHD